MTEQKTGTAGGSLSTSRKKWLFGKQEFMDTHSLWYWPVNNVVLLWWWR